MDFARTFESPIKRDLPWKPLYLCTHDITTKTVDSFVFGNIPLSPLSNSIHILWKPSLFLKSQPLAASKVHNKHIFVLLYRYNDASRLSLSFLSIPFAQKCSSLEYAMPFPSQWSNFRSHLSSSLLENEKHLKREPFSILHHHNTS